MKFNKKLNWLKLEDPPCLYAEPYGLNYRYSIILHKRSKIELAVLDQYYEFAEGYPRIFLTVTAAKQFASKHYLQLLEHIVE